MRAVAAARAVAIAAFAVAHAMAAEEEGEGSGLPMRVQLALALFLICLSAMFAGLTLGIMGVDTLSLEIIADGGSEPDRSYARAILPVRHMGHRALCTLVLGNMWANVMIAKFSADVIPSEGGGGGGGGAAVAGFLVSTFVILIFTEVLPMSVCKSKHALYIAAKGVPVLNVFLILLYPLAAPLGWLLDRIIHHDPGQVYDRGELKRLMAMHADHQGLERTELELLLGAMEFHEQQVSQVMTPIGSVVKKHRDDVIDRAAIEELWEAGHSRVPVVRSDAEGAHCVVGLLYVKDLILLDVDEPVTVGEVLATYPHETLEVDGATRLREMLNLFQHTRTHMAVVVGPGGAAEGVITVEDLVEEMIRGEILDEYDDDAAPNDSAASKLRRRARRVNFYSFTSPALTDEQVASCGAFLVKAVPAFAAWDAADLRSLIRPDTVSVVDPAAGDDPTLYTAGAEAPCMTLVLSGAVDIAVGREGFVDARHSWTVLAEQALSGRFVPAFTATATRRCVVLRIARRDYTAHRPAVAALLDPSASATPLPPLVPPAAPEATPPMPPSPVPAVAPALSGAARRGGAPEEPRHPDCAAELPL